MTTIQPFAMVEKAVRELVQNKYAPAVDKTGGDPDFDPQTVDLYVEVTLIFGATDRVFGEWAVDIDCYSRSYGAAMNAALAIEAAIIGPHHVTSTMNIDNVYQNQAPAERPWDDDAVFKVGGTYAFTARRPSSS